MTDSTNQLNHNYACAAILVIVTYALYCAGNVFINHKFPDGQLLATIIGVILLIFGYSTGRIHEAMEAAKALEDTTAPEKTPDPKEADK